MYNYIYTVFIICLLSHTDAWTEQVKVPKESQLKGNAQLLRNFSARKTSRGSEDDTLMLPNVLKTSGSAPNIMGKPFEESDGDDTPPDTPMGSNKSSFFVTQYDVSLKPHMACL